MLQRPIVAWNSLGTTVRAHFLGVGPSFSVRGSSYVDLDAKEVHIEM